MKIYNLFLMATFALAGVSCTNDLIIPEEQGADGMISSVQTSVSAYSRFNDVDNVWDKGDVIGIYMLGAGTDNILNNASNVEFTAKEDGASVKFSTTTPIKISGENTDFLAYYPYSSDINDFVYDLNLSEQSDGYDKFDLMYAKNTDVDSQSAKTLSFNFEHQLSKVIIKPTLEEGYTLEGVTIEGMPSSCQFNIYTGELLLGEEGKIKTYHNADESSYTAIVTPVSTASSMSIVFSVSDSKGVVKDYSYTVNPEKISSFEAGKSYTLNLDVQTISVPDEGGDEGGDVEGNYDFTIEVDSSTDFSNCMSGKTGKGAILFSADLPVTISNTVTIPAGITELHFTCHDEKQASVTMKDIVLNPDLQKLVFNNLKVTGQEGIGLISESQYMANAGTIEITGCEMSGMEYIYFYTNYDKNNTQGCYQTSFVENFTIDNSIIHDIYSVLYIRAVMHTKFTNSTFYNMGYEIYYFDQRVSDLINYSFDLTVEDCTIVGRSGRNALSGEGNKINLYLSRNIVLADEAKNVVYRAQLTDGAGNYVPEGFSNRIHNGEQDPSVITVVSPAADLLPNYNFENPTNDFTTSYPAGDPRWRIGN